MTPQKRAATMATLMRHGALLKLRRRYARLVQRLCHRLPVYQPSQVESPANRAMADACIERMEGLVDVMLSLEVASTERTGADTSGERRKDRENTQSTHRRMSDRCRVLNEWVESTQRRADRLAEVSLFLGQLETCIYIVDSFEAVRHPVRAVAYYLAGSQLHQAQQIARTVRETWSSGRHPRDVLMTALMQHAPDLAIKFMVQYYRIESWWTTNVRTNAQPVTPKATGYVADVPAASNLSTVVECSRSVVSSTLDSAEAGTKATQGGRCSAGGGAGWCGTASPYDSTAASVRSKASLHGLNRQSCSTTSESSLRSESSPYAAEHSAAEYSAAEYSVDAGLATASGAPLSEMEGELEGDLSEASLQEASLKDASAASFAARGRRVRLEEPAAGASPVHRLSALTAASEGANQMAGPSPELSERSLGMSLGEGSGARSDISWPRPDGGFLDGIDLAELSRVDAGSPTLSAMSERSPRKSVDAG